MTRHPSLSELLQRQDAVTAITAIDDFICGSCTSDDDVSMLTVPQLYFMLNQEFERQVNNGGFEQFFSNWSGDHSYLTVDSLRAIGANATADLLRKAIDQFPNASVPTDHIERNLAIESIREIAEPLWVLLDKQFFEYRDNLDELNLNFVKNNIDYF